MADKLTAKQQVIYDFVRKEIKRNGYAPSVREICDGVGLSSTSTVHAHLETLRKKGYINRFPSKNRTIEILEEGFYGGLRDYSPVPVVEKITKGEPILRDENIAGQYMVPLSYISDGECFMYSPGEDNDKEKIAAGDYVLVAMKSRIMTGELALVYESEIAVIRRIGRKKNSNLEIIGEVVALFRRY